MSLIRKRWKNIAKLLTGMNSALGLATRFVSEVEDSIRRVVDAPTSWRVIDEDVRRCLTHVFPYAILYTIEPDFVLIVAVAHCAREPKYWKQRLNE